MSSPYSYASSLDSQHVGILSNRVSDSALLTLLRNLRPSPDSAVLPDGVVSSRRKEQSEVDRLTRENRLLRMEINRLEQKKALTGYADQDWFNV